MLGGLIVLGVLMIAVGLAGLARPNAVQRWVASMDAMPRYALAVGVRLAMAAFLIAVAPEARWPSPTRVLGYVVLVAALGVLLVGPARLGALVEWWSTKPSTALRVASATAVALGALLIVDAL